MVTTGVDFGAFSPAHYAGSEQWQVYAPGPLEHGATVLLSTSEGDLLTTRRDGSGQVFVSGLNLPYHVSVFDNSKEAAFLERLMGGDRSESTAFANCRGATFVSADSARVSVSRSGATGVLFKENDYPDWHATVNGRRVSIYPAGPGMMYVPARPGAVVRFSYSLSLFEELCLAISLLTLVGLALHPIVPISVQRRLRVTRACLMVQWMVHPDRIVMHPGVRRRFAAEHVAGPRPR